MTPTGGTGGTTTGGSGGTASGGSGGNGDTGGTSGQGAGDAGVGTGGTGEGPADGGVPSDGGTGPAPSGSKILLLFSSHEQPFIIPGMQETLAAHGPVVTFDLNKGTFSADMAVAMGASVIVIGPSCKRAQIQGSPGLKELAIPIIVSKDGPAGDLGMATGDFTTPNDQHSINIVATGDPLAAGFPNGPVMVMGPPNRVVNGVPGPEAKIVATLVGQATRACIFYYLKGQNMIGGLKAPAKRIGFFWHRPVEATDNGKKLLGAAVDWAREP